MNERQHITFDGPDGLRYDPRIHGFIEPDGTLASDERVEAAWDKHDVERALKLNKITDNRTELKKLDTIQACGYCLISRGAWTGPAYWLVNDTSSCDGCILRIASERNGEWLVPALVDIADRHQGQMVKIDTPIPCEIHLLAQEEQRCTGLAHWRASGFAECDECIVNNLELHPDSREVLAPALADIRNRYLKVGARVRMRASSEIGQLGTIYRPNKKNDAWYVRSDRTSASEPGLLCLPEELDVLL